MMREKMVTSIERTEICLTHSLHTKISLLFPLPDTGKELRVWMDMAASGHDCEFTEFLIPQHHGMAAKS